MQIRCNIQIGGQTRKVVLVTQENETPELLALRLASFVLFFDQEPLAEISSKNPAINNQEFRPDLVALNDAGEIKLWVECGNVTTNKLDKLIRRNRQMRIVVLKENQREAENLRKFLKKNHINDSDRVEIWYFPDDNFKAWNEAVGDTVDIVGENAGKSFNLVMNASAFSFDLGTL